MSGLQGLFENPLAGHAGIDSNVKFISCYLQAASPHGSCL
jgi:hypothetical protein